MKTVLVLAVLIAVAVARPSEQDAAAQTTRLENDNIGVGPWKWGFDTSNGISQNEAGEITNPGAEDEAIAVRGSFSYPGEDGKPITVNYIADRNGFQPQGDHLPRA